MPSKMRSIGGQKVVVKEVFPGVWQLDNLIDPAIGHLLAEMSAKLTKPYGPNSMNKYGSDGQR